MNGVIPNAREVRVRNLRCTTDQGPHAANREPGIENCIIIRPEDERFALL